MTKRISILNHLFTFRRRRLWWAQQFINVIKLCYFVSQVLPLWMCICKIINQHCLVSLWRGFNEVQSLEHVSPRQKSSCSHVVVISAALSNTSSHWGRVSGQSQVDRWRKQNSSASLGLHKVKCQWMGLLLEIGLLQFFSIALCNFLEQKLFSQKQKQKIISPMLQNKIFFYTCAQCPQNAKLKGLCWSMFRCFITLDGRENIPYVELTEDISYQTEINSNNENPKSKVWHITHYTHSHGNCYNIAFSVVWRLVCAVWRMYSNFCFEKWQSIVEINFTNVQRY